MSKIIFNGVDYAGGSGNYFNPVIYSDVERVIGVWRDNKPLYAKTWDLGSDIWINNNSWIDIPIRVSDYAIENIIHTSGLNSDGTFFGFLGANRDQTYVQILQTRNAQITLRYVTLYYTKTTDVAGSGDYNTYGVPTVHYSTDEQVIGTWIDGKPLYEKTWDFSGSPISLVYNTWVDSGIDASTNIDTLVNSVLRYGAINCMAVEVGKGAGGFTVGLNKLENLNTRGVTQITLQYTKTTD